jgi:hypothetical protein
MSDYWGLDWSHEEIEMIVPGIRRRGSSKFGFLGPRPERVIRALRLFHEIASEYVDGAKSLHEVAEALELRSVQGGLPKELPVALSSIQRAADDAALIFGVYYYGIGKGELSKAELYVGRHRGLALKGLSDLGLDARQLTRGYLIDQCVIPHYSAPRLI